MRKALIAIKKIEYYILKKISAEEKNTINEKLQRDQLLAQQIGIQRAIMGIVKRRGRIRVYQELDQIHESVWNHPEKRELRTELSNIFKIGA
ncbi:MAG: hypothetical protein AAF242_14090 [Bacteroidota bacterium]